MSIYIWYRKKYPVRMGIGRNFSTFSNPAYNKRASTVTLVREDGNKLFEEMAQRSPETVAELDEDNLDESEGHINQAYEDDKQTYENLKFVYHADTTGEQIETSEEHSGDNAECVEVKVEAVEPPKYIERPRKKAVLIMSEENLDNGFELVTEDDLGRRRESELSVGNASTDTHTVSLSFSDVFDGRHKYETKARSSSEVVELFKTHYEGQPDNTSTGTEERKPRSQSDSFGVLKVNSSARFHKPSAGVLSQITIPEKPADSDEDEFVKIEQAVNKLESEDEANVPEALLNEITEASFNKEEHVGNIEIDNNSLDSVGDISMGVSEASNTDLPVDEDDDNFERVKDTTKRLSLQISTTSIVLDTVPTTPYVLVPDAIIFEPETPNLVHLDNAHHVIRGRRAFTMNDIHFKMTSNSIQNPESKNSEERSKSSPDIFLDDLHSSAKVNQTLDITSDTYMSVSASDTDIAKDDLLVYSPALVKTERESSLEFLPNDDNSGTFQTEYPNTEKEGNVVPEESERSQGDYASSYSSNINDIKSDTYGDDQKGLVESIDNTLSKSDITRNDSDEQADNEAKQPDNEERCGKFEKTKFNDSVDLSASFEPISESFESINSSFSPSLNETSNLDYTPYNKSVGMTDGGGEVTEESKGISIEENANEILRSSTPTTSGTAHLLVEAPGTLGIEKDTLESSEKLKTKIATGMFKFNMNDGDNDSGSDSSPENETDNSKSSIDSTDYSQVQNCGSNTMLGHAAVSGLVRNASDGNPSDQGNGGVMVASIDSTSTSLSWEILDKSTEDNGGDGIGVDSRNQSKADLSWDMADDNEDNSEC